MADSHRNDPPDDCNGRRVPWVRVGADQWSDGADTVPVRQLPDWALGRCDPLSCDPYQSVGKLSRRGSPTTNAPAESSDLSNDAPPARKGVHR